MSARAVEVWSDEAGEWRLSLDTSVKASSLLSYAPDDPDLFPHRRSALGLFRARLGVNLEQGSLLNYHLAYEHSAMWASMDLDEASGGTILPSTSDVPFRLTQLHGELAENDRFVHRHELDRALAAFHPDWGEVTVGRQAIGLGRGALFSAVDMFAPFSPLEADREWRRGVDAVRAEYRLSRTSSAEVLAVLGESWDESAVLGRLRGYVGNLDGELLVGRRGRDELAAGIVSAAVAEAEVHLELAALNTPEKQPDGGLFGDDHHAGKAVLGSSYTFDVGNGLTLLGEAHYNGLGVKDSSDLWERLDDKIFQERLLRGDMQTLGRHAVGAQLSYPFNDVLSGTFTLVGNPRDGSGTASPGLRWDLSRSASLIAIGYLPWGRGPDDGELRSEYGGAARSLFLQLALYF